MKFVLLALVFGGHLGNEPRRDKETSEAFVYQFHIMKV